MFSDVKKLKLRNPFLLDSERTHDLLVLSHRIFSFSYIIQDVGNPLGTFSKHTYITLISKTRFDS